MSTESYRTDRPDLCKDNSWSTLYAHRRAAAARFGPIHALPIVRRVREVVLGEIRRDANVLEVGAGGGRLGMWIERLRPQAHYESMDVDPAGEHDYTSLDDIRRQYDLVVALEVIEHLSLADIGPWLRRLRDLTLPGGLMILSTPNTFYPPAYLRDATHQTPLCYDELAGLVAAAGFDVLRLARVYHDPWPRRLARRYLFGWLFRLLGFDFARQIVLVARRPPDGPEVPQA